MFVKIYHYVNEASESENKNSSEISEQNGTSCRYVKSKIQKFIKIRITLPSMSLCLLLYCLLVDPCTVYTKMLGGVSIFLHLMAEEHTFKSSDISYMRKIKPLV